MSSTSIKKWWDLEASGWSRKSSRPREHTTGKFLQDHFAVPLVILKFSPKDYYRRNNSGPNVSLFFSYPISHIYLPHSRCDHVITPVFSSITLIRRQTILANFVMELRSSNLLDNKIFMFALNCLQAFWRNISDSIVILTFLRSRSKIMLYSWIHVCLSVCLWVDYEKTWQSNRNLLYW